MLLSLKNHSADVFAMARTCRSFRNGLYEDPVLWADLLSRYFASSGFFGSPAVPPRSIASASNRRTMRWLKALSKPRLKHLKDPGPPTASLLRTSISPISKDKILARKLNWIAAVDTSGGDFECRVDDLWQMPEGWIPWAMPLPTGGVLFSIVESLNQKCRGGVRVPRPYSFYFF